jgi:hypothetical protein
MQKNKEKKLINPPTI